MPFSRFDDATRALLRDVLDGAMLVLEATGSDATLASERGKTYARVTSQLVAAAAEGERDFETLQLRALEGFE